MRIGVNVLFLIPGEVGGSEIYTRNLLSAVAQVDSENRYFVYRNRESTRELVPDRANFIDRPQPVRARSRPARIVYEQTRLLGALRADRVDVILNMGYTGPLLARVPMATIFYDLQYKHHPEFFRKLDLAAWSVLLPLTARRSAQLFSMSRDGERDLAATFPWANGKIALVPHGVDEALLRIGREREPSARAEPLLLCVSALRANKNLEQLLHAFAAFRTAHPEYRLAIVGPRDGAAERLETLREQLHLQDAVSFTGWIAREDVLDFFARARALVFPSRFEGFGIPILEGLAARLPIACSDIPPTREIAGEAAVYFDPDRVTDMTAALESVAFDEAARARVTALGDSRAQRYSWAANATTLVTSLVSLRRGVTA